MRVPTRRHQRLEVLDLLLEEPLAALATVILVVVVSPLPTHTLAQLRALGPALARDHPRFTPRIRARSSAEISTTYRW